MNGALVTVRAIGSLVAVLGLLGLFVWALRRGSLKLTALAPKGTIAIETAMSLGERRSIAIVGVEGRRLLIGLTPTTISLLTDLTPKTSAAASTLVPTEVRSR
jgi:flagellar biogenesis protein FliO